MAFNLLSWVGTLDLAVCCLMAMEMSFLSFTQRAAVDLQVVAIMRAILNTGLRPASLSSLLLEFHTKVYSKAYVQREPLIRK
jgi:hypothetical protein